MSGYVLHVELHAGKDFPIHGDHGQAHAVVMDLMSKCHLLNKGYQLFTDNFYTKPVHAQMLSDGDTLLTGMIQVNTKDLPPLPSKLEVGECEKRSQRKPVLMLSTSEMAGFVEVRTGAGVLKRKPHCIAAYNRFMGGVDLGDRKIYRKIYH